MEEGKGSWLGQLILFLGMEEQVAAVMVNKSAELRKERINLTKSKSNGEQKQRINTARVVCNNFLFLFCFFCICVSVHLCGCFLWLSGQVGFLSASLLACFHGRLRTCESWRGMGSLFSQDKVVKFGEGGGVCTVDLVVFWYWLGWQGSPNHFGWDYRHPTV